MKLKTQIKNLLVDLDGTLLGNHNVPLTIDFTKRAFKHLKPYGSWTSISKTLFQIFREYENEKATLPNHDRVVRLFSQNLNMEEAKADELLRQTVCEVFPNLKRHFFPIPGAKAFLEWAKPQYKLILATNPVWPEDIIHLRIKWAGLDPSLFESVTHAHRMHACKPKGRYYEEILEQENLEAAHTLLIGDKTSMDLPATKVGIPVFIVGETREARELKPVYARAQAFQGGYGDLKRLLSDSK